jgi:hypothetical protein
VIRQLVIDNMQQTLAMLRAEQRNEANVTESMRWGGYRAQVVETHAADAIKLLQAVTLMEGALTVLRPIP